MNRVASYRTMSSKYLSDEISVLKLSEAGFSYTGRRSVIKCEGCQRRIRLKQLKHDGRMLDPTEATFHRNNCKFVICETRASSSVIHAEHVTDKRFCQNQVGRSCTNFSLHNGYCPQDNGAQYSGAQYNGAQYDGSQYSGAQYNGAQYNGSLYSGAQYNGAQYDGSLCSGAQYNGAQYNGARYNGAQYNGAGYNGAQYSGAQYNGAQYNGAQYNGAQYNGAQYSENVTNVITSINSHSEDVDSQENSDFSDDSFSRDSENEETTASAIYQEASRQLGDLSTYEPNKVNSDIVHVVTHVPNCMNALGESFKKPANQEDVDRSDNLLRSSHHEAFSIHISEQHRETSNENLLHNEGLVRRRRTQPVLVGRPLHVLSGVADTEDPRTALAQPHNALQSAITLRLCESPDDQNLSNAAELNSTHTDSIPALDTARISTKRAKKVVHATQDVIHRQNPMPSAASSVQLNFRLASNRERSFRNGPQHLQAFAHFQYARGFFYTGRENIVRCWRCQYGCWIGREHDTFRILSQHLDHQCHSGAFSNFIHWFTRH